MMQNFKITGDIKQLPKKETSEPLKWNFRKLYAAIMRKNVLDLNGGITFVCKRHLFYSYVIMSTAFLAKSAKKKLKISGFFFLFVYFFKTQDWKRSACYKKVWRNFEIILSNILIFKIIGTLKRSPC